MLEPTTYLIGQTKANWDGLGRYLKDTGQSDFMEDVQDAEDDGITGAEILCSFYAKLCYAALTPDKNPNVTKVRGIHDNIRACHDHGHGSVFEHAVLNFITTNCSRVFTHELVRHRAGTAFSQTSGRYVRLDSIRIVDGDPLLDPVRNMIEEFGEEVQMAYHNLCEALDVNRITDMPTKKKMTSALRRIAPQGIANEIGWSANFRALRHMVMMRTSRHAEWEIRKVFHDVYELVDEGFPTVFEGAKRELVDGLWEVTGLNMQPYEG